MKTILAIDTETTGLPNDPHGEIHDVANWPRIVQLGWVLAREDGRVLRSRCSLIQPDGWRATLEAHNVHNFNSVDCREHGLPIATELKELHRAAREADVVVAHSMAFDYPVILCESIRLGSYTRLANCHRECTKLIGCELLEVPGPNEGERGVKLGDLHEFLFGRRFDGAHGAMADAMACLRCYLEMKARTVICPQ